MKRALIFDFGGVFMKTVDHEPRLYWDRRLNLSPGSVERIVHGSESWRQAQLGLISLNDYWADVAGQLAITPDETQQLAHDFYSGDQLDTEMVALAQQLRANGHPVALLSNDSLALLNKLQGLGIVDLFNPLVVSAQIGVMKPDPRSYQTVLDRLQRPAPEAIFIDDMPANIAGATALTIRGIHYTTTEALKAALQPLLTI